MSDECEEVLTIDVALQALLVAIAEGYEYPDAEYRVARRYGVNQHELCLAYDRHCGAEVDEVV